MKTIGKLFINCRLEGTLASSNKLIQKKLFKGDFVDVINETSRDSREFRIERDGLFHFGVTKEGIVFLQRIED